VCVASSTWEARFPTAPIPSTSCRAARPASGFARAAYDITDRLQVAGQAAVRRGDVESTTRQNLAIFLASDAIAADPTFGSDFYAYRLRGTTVTANATLSWALSERSSLNLSYAVARTAAYDDLNYLSRIGTILLAFRY
jgi:hypothetical protein